MIIQETIEAADARRVIQFMQTIEIHDTLDRMQNLDMKEGRKL
jgi:hypothetical protein